MRLLSNGYIHVLQGEELILDSGKRKLLSGHFLVQGTPNLLPILLASLIYVVLWLLVS